MNLIEIVSKDGITIIFLDEVMEINYKIFRTGKACKRIAEIEIHYKNGYKNKLETEYLAYIDFIDKLDNYKNK